MIFSSRINNIPCKIDVIEYRKRKPMRITGSGFGDADPPEDPIFTFLVLDRKGYSAPWLAKYVTDADVARIQEEYEFELQDEYYRPYD